MSAPCFALDGDSSFIGVLGSSPGLVDIAEGEAEAIEKVYAAIHEGDPTNDLIAIKYLESLEKVANGKATKVFLPTSIK